MGSGPASPRQSDGSLNKWRRKTRLDYLKGPIGIPKPPKMALSIL